MNRAGIALMEVLLSMAIVGIAMGALLSSASAALRAESKVEERAVGARLAEQQLLAIRSGQASREPGESQGQFAEPFSQYKWSCRIVPSQAEGPFLLVTLDILKGEGRRLLREQTVLAASP